MINKLRKGMVLVLTGFFCLMLFDPAFSQETTAGPEMTVKQLVSAVNQKWSNTTDFQCDLAIGRKDTSEMNMEGVMWQSGKLFRMELTLPPKVVGPQNKPAEPLKALMVFDGKVLWLTQPHGNEVTKIDYSALKGNGALIHGPFFLAGLALKPPYSLPNLPYKLSEKKRSGADYYFLETSEINKFFLNSPVTSDRNISPPAKEGKGIGIWVNKTTLFPNRVEFDLGENAPQYVEFKNIKTNQGLSADFFTFRVPESTQVRDMTELIER